MSELLILEEQLIQLTPKIITISGIVTEDGHPISGKVCLYDRQTLSLIASTDSNPSTGAYSFSLSSTENYEYFLVCLPYDIEATSTAPVLAGPYVIIPMTFIPSNWFVGKNIRIKDETNEEVITILEIGVNTIRVDLLEHGYAGGARLSPIYNALVLDRVCGE